MKLEEEKQQEKCVAYVEAYLQLTPSDEQKGVRELHQDFKKKKQSHLQATSHQDLFCMSISDHNNDPASTIDFR